ncbi:hypothetical protein [Acinetobacter sp. A47]|uniref:hypothetical protein n=1 Tax=Acinetobacter sp. A47 TaxID=1561217 RepID=UPI00056F52E2|nr:hypothetical protein [Acinetobacter sp. A47]
MLNINPYDFSLVAVHDPHSITIDVPLPLAEALKQLLSHYRVNYSTVVPLNGISLFRAEIDIDISDLDLQKELLKNQFPFKFEIEGRDDRDEAYLYAGYTSDGNYAHKGVEYDNQFTGISTLMYWQTEGILSEKLEELAERCRPWSFTQIDVEKAKVIALKFMVRPGAAHG